MNSNLYTHPRDQVEDALQVLSRPAPELEDVPERPSKVDQAIGRIKSFLRPLLRDVRTVVDPQFFEATLKQNHAVNESLRRLDALHTVILVQHELLKRASWVMMMSNTSCQKGVVRDCRCMGCTREHIDHHLGQLKEPSHG